MGIGSSTIELLWINKVLAFNGKIKVVNDGNLKNNCSKKKVSWCIMKTKKCIEKILN